jgi:hypothetical protein
MSSSPLPDQSYDFSASAVNANGYYERDSTTRGTRLLLGASYPLRSWKIPRWR